MAAVTGKSAPLRVVVLGLGDLGRSPRLQYHALALANAGTEVDLIAYAGHAPVQLVREHPRIHCRLLPAPSARRHTWSAARWLGYSVLRFARDAARLIHRLVVMPRPDVILLQSPPALPTLAVGWLAARVRGAKLIIDWHNFGYAMLALRLGPNAVLVHLARWHERIAGAAADAHLCVSQAMQRALRVWGIDAQVLYDRPASVFVPLPDAARPAVRHRVLGELLSDIGADGVPVAVVVSPTSWSVDEDFGLLLDAAERLEALVRSHPAEAGRPSFPRVLIVVSGDGPLRARYDRAFRARHAHAVHLRTVWVTADDYPLLLSSADAGLSLHRSAAGVDLPMKVADLFGAGVPVLALNYGAAVAEQIRDGENGLLFSGADELAERLYVLFARFADGAPELARLRATMRNAATTLTWEAGWKAEAEPLFARA